MRFMLGRKRALVLAMLTAAMLVVAGCGGDDDDDGGSAGGGDGTVEARTIALVNLGTSSPVTAAGDEVVRAAAERLGWTVEHTDAQADPAQAAAALQAAVNQGVDAIVANAIAADYATEALTQAQQQGIPVVQIVSGEAESDLYAGQYGSDETEFGRTLAEYIVENQPDAQIAELTASILPAGQQRNEGLAEVIEGTDVEIAASVEPDITNPVQDAQERVNDMLTADPSISAVWTVFDNFTPGVVAAVENRDSDVNVYGFFASPPHLELLREDGPLTAVADNNAPKTGVIAIDQLLYHFEQDQEIDPNALEEDPLEYTVYDRENLPAGEEQVWDTEAIIEPYVEKWAEDFPGTVE